MEDQTPFLLRTRILENLKTVLEHLHQRILDHTQKGNYLAPEGVDWRRGKLSQGDHLDGVPYIYLDFPHFLDEENSFTFRTLFWWGHGVSFSFILGGEHLPTYRERLLENLEVLEALEIHLSTAENPWDWKQGPGHTIPLGTERQSQILATFKAQSFLKCCRFLGFEEPELRENRIDEAGIYAFRALEPLILE